MGHGVLRWLACAALVAACESHPVELHDENAFQPGGRVLYRPGAATGEDTWFGLELDVAHAEGDDEQGVAAGDNVVFDDEIFVGPTELDADYELDQATLVMVFGQELSEDVSGRLLFGAAWHERELELTSGAQRGEDDERWAGVLVGVDTQWSFVRGLGLGGRVTGTTDGTSVMQVLELGLLVAPRAPLGAFLGWRWFEYSEENSSESDVDLHANGPTLGLRGSL